MLSNGIAAAEFNANAAALYVIAAVVILYILAQSIFFLVRALKQSKKLGMDKGVIKRTVRRAAIFAIAPATAIFIGVAALIPKLGIPLPWLRLSVIGSLVYETAAAKAGADAFGEGTWESLSITSISAEQYVTIAFIMSIGCLLPLVCVTLFTKKYSSGMLKMEKKDKQWGAILASALFMGVVSCFFAVNFCGVTKNGLQGWIPIFVILISASTMILFGVMQKLTKWHWINDYALPVSMIVGMVCSVPIYNAIAA